MIDEEPSRPSFEYTSDLLDLLKVLGRLIELEAAQWRLAFDTEVRRLRGA